MIDWVEQVWKTRPGGLLRCPFLLLFGQFPRTIKNSLQFPLNAKYSQKKAKVEANMALFASLLQSLTYQSISYSKKKLENFYAEYNMQWYARIIFNLRKESDGHRFELMCRWILQSWNIISPGLVVISFKKT